MKCNRCKENKAAHVVQYKDTFYPEEICDFCSDKDQEEIDFVLE